MNKKLLFSIIALALVGGLFSVVYAGPIMTTITLAGTVDMVNNQIKNLQDPTDPQDATTKSYVDSLFSCDGAAQSCVVGLGECQNSGINVCMMGTAQCSVSAGAPSTELCDGLDNDCDGTADEGNPGGGAACDTGFVGICQEGVISCDDGGLRCIEFVSPDTVVEVCDSLDNDCNGVIDEGVTTTFFEDGDGDGFGNLASFVEACSQPDGFVTDNTDCDDGQASVNPAQMEICDGLDNNCNGVTDEGGVCPVCGNGIVEGVEECDDGNTVDGDGCSAVCLVEN